MSVDADDLARLREELRSEDPAVRRAACAAVSGLLDDAARAIVAEALASDNPEVHKAAEGLLSRLAEA